jgi:uncharacterized protein (DUF302 family)
MPEYALSKSLESKFDDVLAKLPEALAREEFGIITQIDVKNVFAQKLNLPFRRYQILGVCNPKLAYRVLSGNLLAGIMLPCNVVLWEKDDGTTMIAAVEATQVPAAKSDPTIAELADDVVSRLERVFEVFV